MQQKIKYYVWLVFAGFSLAAGAQKNLVQNPGFEQIIKTSPTSGYNHNQNPNVYLVSDWVVPTLGTSDYYNSDKSTIHGVALRKARTGEGRVGIILKAKKIDTYCEYVETRLKEPLQEGKKYFVQFYFSLDKRADSYAPSVGVCLTRENLYSNANTVLPVRASITCSDRDKMTTQEGWAKFSGIYEAKGGEEYLTIGNFETRPGLMLKNGYDWDRLSDLDKSSPFNEYAYYYVDDVCVQEVLDSTCTTCCDPVTEPNSQKSFNNFVFMIDISSSMIKGGYLEEVKQSVVSFVDTLGKNDLVSLLTFDGNTYVLLKKVKASNKEEIERVVEGIVAGSSTNVDKAVTVAYYIMDSSMIEGGNNRVILASDAIFKLSKQSSKTIKHYYKKKHVAFTMVQFGHQHNKGLEKLCRKTDGNYSNTKDEDMGTALKNQVETPLADEYTHEKRGLHIANKAVRILLVASLIALVILVKR